VLKTKNRKTSAETVERTYDDAWLETIAPVSAEVPIGAKGNIGWVGDSYVQVLVVTKFPPNPGKLWLTDLDLKGVTVHVACKKKNALAFNGLLSRSIDGWKFKFSGERTDAEGKLEASDNALKSQVLLALSRDGNATYDVVVTLLVRADSEKELKRRTKAVISSCASASYVVQAPWTFAEQLYKQAGPFGYLDPRVAEIFSLPMSARTIAYSGLFSTPGINDGQGSLLGTTQQEGGSAVVFNLWKFGFGKWQDRHNANLICFGNSGGGKSTFLKLELFYNVTGGCHALITDPENEFKSVVRLLGGQYFDCGDSGKYKINPLEVLTKSHITTEGDDDVSFMPFTRHMAFLDTFFKLLLDIGSHSHILLRNELRDFYRNQGITETDGDLSHIKEWKILEDLLNQIKSSFYQKRAIESGEGMLEENQRNAYALLIDALENLTHSQCGVMWNGQTNIELDSRVIAFGTNSLIDAPHEVMAAQYQLINQLKWGRLQRNNSLGIRTIDLHDEAHLEIDPRVPATAEALRQMAKRIRKYNGSLWLASQSTIDFTAKEVERVGKGILNLMTNKFVFGAEGDEADSIAKLNQLSNREKDEILNAAAGKCIMISGNRRTMLYVSRPPKLIQYITTSEREKGRVRAADKDTPVHERWLDRHAA